jgi:hypothetical protein
MCRFAPSEDSLFHAKHLIVAARGWQNRAKHCQAVINSATVWRISSRCAQSAGFRHRSIEHQTSVRVAFAGILLTSQSLMLLASAQDGFRATQDNLTAANHAEVHLHNYGEFDKACVVWTDGCRNCSRDAGCSNLGIACQPKEVTCLQYLPSEKNNHLHSE